MNLKNKTSRIYPYQEKNFYDRFLKIKKITKKSILISIGIFLFIVFFWPSFLSQNKFNNLKKSTNTIVNYNKDTSSENFNFQGIDEFDQPFYLQAKEYQIIENEKNKFFFIKPKAEINLKEGKWLTMVAKEGIFDLEKQTLELIGDVLFLHSDGQQIDTNSAIIDLKKGKIYGNKKIFLKNETINFSSDGFELNQTGKVFQLLGKSKIKIK